MTGGGTASGAPSLGDVQEALLARLTGEGMRQLTPRNKKSTSRWIKVPRALTLEAEEGCRCVGCVACLLASKRTGADPLRLSRPQLRELIHGRGSAYKLLLTAYRWGRVYGYGGETLLPDILRAIQDGESSLSPKWARKIDGDGLVREVERYLGHAAAHLPVHQLVDESLPRDGIPGQQQCGPEFAPPDRDQLDRVGHRGLSKLQELDLVRVISDSGRPNFYLPHRVGEYAELPVKLWSGGWIKILHGAELAVLVALLTRFQLAQRASHLQRLRGNRRGRSVEAERWWATPRKPFFEVFPRSDNITRDAVARLTQLGCIEEGRSRHGRMLLLLDPELRQDPLVGPS